MALDENDAVALMTVAENISLALKAAIEQYFVRREMRKKALLTILVHVSRLATEFMRQQDASQWIEEFAETWCRSWRTEPKVQDRAENQFRSWTWEASPKHE